MSHVLVIDDNEGVRTALEILLTIHDISPVCVATPEEGVLMLKERDFNLVIQDMNFSRNITSGDEGIDLFHQIRKIDPDIPIILITAWTNLETAIELVKEGAADYLQKPWDDPKLITSVKNLLRLEQATRSQQTAITTRNSERRQLARQFDLCGMVFASEAMLKLVSMATQVAKADVPVLITGPNGSGKEKIAEIIQANSSVKQGPFVKVNAGALPHDLMEAELFGAEEGAFTGAKKSRKGRFEQANNGTLFLDEIGNLPLDGQIKLLRVIQSGEFERLGSSKSQRTNVRLICATNADLEQGVLDKTFRQDLLYRINVIQLEIPALGKRRDDILPLAEHFLQGNKSLSEEAKKALLDYPWPGNVRELQNCMQRAALLSPDDVIQPSVLGLDTALKNPDKIDNEEHELTADEIVQVLKQQKGVVARAARELGLSRQALYRRMNKYKINL